MIEDIENKLIIKQNLTKDEIKRLLDYIVSSVKIIVNDDTFINKCDLVQGLIGRYLNNLGVANYPSITNKCVMPNVIGHSFIVTTINDTSYIIDPTFVQFAYVEMEDLYIDHIRVKSKSPFEYAVNINKQMTKELLNNGYIELNDKSAYWYGNSFYHTLTNISDNYEFNNIPGKVYVNSFLKGNETLKEYGFSEIKTSIFDSKNK